MNYYQFFTKEALFDEKCDMCFCEIPMGSYYDMAFRPRSVCGLCVCYACMHSYKAKMKNKFDKGNLDGKCRLVY